MKKCSPSTVVEGLENERSGAEESPGTGARGADVGNAGAGMAEEDGAPVGWSEVAVLKDENIDSVSRRGVISGRGRRNLSSGYCEGIRGLVSPGSSSSTPFSTIADNYASSRRMEAIIY